MTLPVPSLQPPYAQILTMKIKRSNLIPAVLLVYLGVMSYIGYPEFQQGHYLYYFGVIGVTLFIIAILRVFLKKRERYHAEHDRRRLEN